MLNSKVLVAAGAVLLAAALALGGYTLYASKQKLADEAGLAQLVAETTALLRQGLATPSRESVSAIDAGLEKLKSSRSRAFAGAAEQYIVSAREIVRRRVDADRLAREAAASRQALIAHMNRSERRNTTWIGTALQLKKNVELVHADLARALKTLDELLFGLVDAQKQLAPFVRPDALLPDAERENARAVAKAQLAEAEARLQGVRNITP